MSEVTIGGNVYRIGRLNTFAQWHVARRLLPVLSALGEGMFEAVRRGGPLTPPAVAGEGAEGAETAAPFNLDILAVIAPLADVLGQMTDTDSEYILNTCLSVVSRQDGAGYAPVKVPNAPSMQYTDIDLSAMLSLVLAVVREHRLLDFTSVLPSAPT